jgi:hypothetical protein
MVEKARQRLCKFGPRVTVAAADLGSPDWLRGVESPLDAVVSGLAIHHLTDPFIGKSSGCSIPVVRS